MIPPHRTSSSSTLTPAAHDQDGSSVRPRNRRLASARDEAASLSQVSSPGQSPSRGASPIPPPHIGSVTGRNDSNGEFARGGARGKNPAVTRGLFDSPWAPSWASVQEFATTLLTGAEPGADSRSDRPVGRDVSRTRNSRAQAGYGDVSKRAGSWGPEPPREARPHLRDVAAGSLAEREASLRAMRTASVLESHEGVNGGLDIVGNLKKRRSDEQLQSSAHDQDSEEHLVYIHHVQNNDTYAGIVLKYRCREDAFRKANGLWSRDNIQTRKWLAIPVDACEVKGRPCDGPTSASSRVDLLARTPEESSPFGTRDARTDFFASTANGHTPSSQPKKGGEEDQPWTHVRWVSLDSSPHPVEIARVPRKALGYFPPRRKKSIHTLSSLSTPRGSVDIPSITLGSEAGPGSPGSASSRRPSLLSNRPPFTSTPAERRSRVNSGGDDLKPAWMRRPGGVGSLNRTVRAPGPEKDYFNTWTNKHLGLNTDSLPSMSVMGSEIARFGFGNAEQNAAGIAESPFRDGRDTADASRQGNGLDKAATAIETWLRGAFAKVPGPGTPVLRPRGRSTGPIDAPGDLIELTDTNSDDGRGGLGGGGAGGGSMDFGGLLSSAASGPTGWSVEDGGSVRGRTTTAAGGNASRNKKSD